MKTDYKIGDITPQSIGPNGEENQTFYSRLLTSYEKKLLELADPGFLDTFTSDEPDISKEKMKLSKSGAKFDFSDCWRGTFFIDAS